MPFRYEDVISLRSEPRRSAYTDTQAMLYNLGIGMGRDPFDEDELPFVLDDRGLRVVPSFASVMGGDAGLLNAFDIDWSRVLHAEQRIAFHRPLPPAAELVATSLISEITDKGPEKGAYISVDTEVSLVSGEPLYTSKGVMVARGDGGCGGPTKSQVLPHVMPEREPDIVHVTQTRPDQALLYRLSGDRNPLHADPVFARRVGFPGPVLHGLCSYGIACRAVLQSVCGYDPARMKTFDVRFTSPVFPGETIETDIWIDGEVVSFRSRIPARGITSLNNGRSLVRAAD